MEQTIYEQPTTINTKPRKGYIAFLFSIILPGLGQVYNGQPKKGAIFFVLLLVFPILFGLTHLTTFFYGLSILLVIQIVIQIYIITDGVNNAKRLKEYVLKPYNTWYFYLLIWVFLITMLIVFDLETVLGIRTFKIPTTSGNPTFQVGDWLVADMKAYKNNEPDYGDIVVYSSTNGQIYSYRVVGRPNDSIELINNIVSVNGKPSKATFIKETTNDEMPVFEFEEELPNGHKHLLYKFKEPFDSTKENIKNIVVPPNSYYLLGDNRDNAADSRYQGFISKDKIKGRIIYSYWGKTGTNRMNISFTDK